MSDIKKPIHQLSEEELLDLLEKSPDVSENKTTELDLLQYDDDLKISAFLAHFNIVHGDQKVSSRLLMDLYKNYTKTTINSQRFNSQMGRYLTCSISKNIVHYNINIDMLKISEYLLKEKSKGKKTVSMNNARRKRFEEFLKDNNITSGQKWLQGYIIYEIYLDYIKKNNKSSLFSYRKFIMLLSLYFQGKRITENKSRWFRVNIEAVNYFTKEKRDEIEKGRCKKKGKKRF